MELLIMDEIQDEIPTKMLSTAMTNVLAKSSGQY